MKEAKYSQGQKEVDSLVLPGEEASPAKISYDHRQEVLMERGKTQRKVTSWKRREEGTEEWSLGWRVP